jgi:mitochondrial intermediate peptidase
MLAWSARYAIRRSVARPFFRFRGCLLERTELRKRTAATQTSHIPASVDDKGLIELFDHPKSSLSFSPLSATGLFGHSTLTQPRALISLAEATVIRAQLLTDRILRAPQSRDELKKVVKNLDRLSDMLCGVIDLAELIRHAHPDTAWVGAANHAYETLCGFMNVLNTHVGLYQVRNKINGQFFIS